MIPRRGSRDSRKAVPMNKRHPYRDMEREYITSDISLRELCRKHDISAHSLVTVQAKRLKWAEKREQYQAKESDAFMSRYAARQADRLAEIHDKAIPDGGVTAAAYAPTGWLMGRGAAMHRS